MNYAAPPHDPLVGTTFDGRFQIQARLGEGGMGVVYKALQLAGNHTVALKMLSSSMASDPEWVKRFYNEARACEQLRHPNTIRMYEFGQAKDGKLYMTMEFLDGPSLGQAIAKWAPMPAVRVLSILAQACSSLEEAHGRSIIHRDIKPDNLFVLPVPRPDFVKLLDFSVAKLTQDRALRTQAGIVFGTPEYMAPETARGQTQDPRSDLYSLGILAFEMLTGKPPFSGPNPMAVLAMHTGQKVPPLPANIPAVAAAIVVRALEKDADRRFQSATEMRGACEAALSQLVGGVPNRQSGALVSAAMPPRASAAMSSASAAPQQGGGAPQKRTMIASAQGGGQAAAGQRPQDKTLYASQSPLAGGPPPPVAGGPPPPVAGGPPPPVGGPPPAAPAIGSPPPAQSSAAPQQKTLYAAHNPLQSGGGAPSAVKSTVVASASTGTPVQAPYGGPPSMPKAPAQTGGVKKTMMLQPSEGVVSYAQPNMPAPPLAPTEGASALFWVVSLIIGAAVGVGAYMIVLAAS